MAAFSSTQGKALYVVNITDDKDAKEGSVLVSENTREIVLKSNETNTVSGRSDLVFTVF